MNFYQFYQMQSKIEINGIPHEDWEIMCDYHFDLTWFTTCAKLAIEENNIHHPDYHGLNSWKFEAEAMLSAYYRTGYITAADYKEILDQFHHLMRVSYRLKDFWKRGYRRNR